MFDDESTAGSQPPVDQPIQLVGGVNFTTWPDLKWSRGNSHISHLKSRFSEWLASAPVSVDTVLRKDRQGIDLIAHVPRGIPKHEWSLDLGDALHNLRSAFDAVAWGMAHFKETQPTRPKRVTFPICEYEKDWDEAVKVWIGEIHPEFQERLRIMQPFTYVPPGGVSVLSMLHDLDIQDKHRDILMVSTDLHQINLSGSFEYEDHSFQATPRIEMHPYIKFSDGVVLGTIHAGASIKMLNQIIIRPITKLQLIHRGTTHEVASLLDQLVAETRRYLDILMLGLAKPNDPADVGWSPMDVGPL